MVVTMQEAITNAKANFPSPKRDIKMNEHGRKPTPVRILHFNKYLQQCAISISNTTTELGYLGLVVPNETYETLNYNNGFVIPQEPDAAPVLQLPAAPAQATRAAAAPVTTTTEVVLTHQAAMKVHQIKKQEWANYKAARTALRNLITSNIDKEYLTSFNHEITCFTLVPPLEVIESIQEQYGTVDETDLEANEMAKYFLTFISNGTMTIVQSNSVCQDT